MLPLIIVNPASADGATGDAWPGIASEVRRHFGPFSVAFTQESGDAARIARREAEAGRALVIACGGDGTINEAANGVLESGADCEFGILPSGTGGDFRRTLRIPERASDAALALRRGRTRRMDVGRVTYAGRDGARAARYFLNVASFGMGGEVIRRVKGNRRLPRGGARLVGGRASFAAAALGAALEYENPSVVVRLDDNPERRLVVTNICVANARYFGGGMKIAPDAKLTDGRFDVVAVGRLSTPAILANSYKLYLGTHLRLREVGHALAARVSARAAGGGGKILLEVDGELAGTLPAEFEMLPRALRVRVPA